MIESRYAIHLQDEVPALGSGQRVVLARVGRVWVKARNEVGGKSFTRIRLSTWESFNPRLIDLKESTP